MSIYNRQGEVRLMASMLEAIRWEVEEGVIEEAAVQVLSAEEILEAVGKEPLLEYMQETSLKPTDLFEVEDLERWAEDNGWVYAAHLALEHDCDEDY